MNYRHCIPALAIAGALVYTPALADPISGTIAAIAGTISASVAVGATVQTLIFFAVEGLLYAALSAGLSYLPTAIAGKPKTPPVGVQGSLQFGDGRSRSFTVGDFCTSGSLIYANTWTYPGSDKPNEFLTMVVALSDRPITSIDKIFVGDQGGTYSTSGHTTPYIPGYSIAEFEAGANYYLWARIYDGTQTSADPELINIFGADPNYPWTSSMAGTGMAYAVITARFNTSVFAGFPQLRFQGRGIPLYDPRADDTVGGSGSQRFADASTWAFSRNPIVMIYNILRGLSGPGGQWLYGLQTLNASRLPLDNWSAAMNACDASVDNLNGTSEASYRAGAEILVSATPYDVINELLKSCNGRIAEIGGVYKISVGGAPVASLSFTDNDLLISQPQTFAPFPSLDNTINSVTAKYPEPSEAWNLKDAPALYDADLEAEDGDRRLPAAVQYDVVPYASQVQRLMASALLEARKFRKHTIVMPPLFWLLEPLDTVSWTSTKNGYIDKLFRVDAMDDNDNLDVGMQISECDPADYDFDPGTDYRTPHQVVVLAPFQPSLNVPPNALAALLEAKTFLRDVQRLLDHYAEIAIGQQYTTTLVLPGLVAGVSASVTREVTLRADADSALAELVETAQATADLGTATALIRWEAGAGPPGVVSRLALESRVETSVGFEQAGLYLDALDDGLGNRSSQITLEADTIFINADAGRVLLSNGGITTALLADAAATGHGSGSYSGPTAGSSAPSSFTTLLTVSHTATGKPIEVAGAIGLSNPDNSNHTGYFRLMRDSTQIWPQAGWEGIVLREFQTTFIPIMWKETPAADDYDYKVQWKSDHVNLQAHDVVLIVDEIKR